MASVRTIFGTFLFLFQFTVRCFGGVCNKTIIPLALVGYEMVIAKRLVGYLIG